MARAQEPATPAQEVVSATERLAEGSVLTRDLADFIQSGISIIVGSVGPDGRPIAGIGLACTVGAAGRIRLILRQPANAGLLAAIAAGGSLAATFSRPVSHRSIQLKARTARVAPVHPGDEDTVARQAERFRLELIAVDHGEALAELYVAHEPGELVALEFLPDRAFVQTPGPGAGARLAG